MISLFAFFYALYILCEFLKSESPVKNTVGIQYSKRALIDRLVVRKSSGKSGFEEGLDKFEREQGRISRNLKHRLVLNQKEICLDILEKYSVSYRHLPSLEKFLVPLSMIIETQEEVYLLIHNFFNQVGSFLFEKALISSGRWLEFRGRSFEDFCHIMIKKRCQLTTFRTKIKDEFHRDVGDIDLGILMPPYIFLCDCKDYRVNSEFLLGKERAVLSRIMDVKHGYLSWLSKQDKICSNLKRNFVYDLISKNGSNPKLFKYLVPVVVTWRPEFILDTSSNMLNKDIPRVCTLFELCKILETVPDGLPNRPFIIPL